MIRGDPFDKIYDEYPQLEGATIVKAFHKKRFYGDRHLVFLVLVLDNGLILASISETPYTRWIVTSKEDFKKTYDEEVTKLIE